MGEWKERTRNFPITYYLSPITRFLLCWFEDRRSVVSDADGKSRARTLACQALDAGEIESQPRRANLHTEARLALRFSSERPASGARVGAAVYFASDTELPIDPNDARDAVGQHIILGKQFGWSRENANAEVAERVHAPVAAKLLSN